MIYKETIDAWMGLGTPNATEAVLNSDRIFNLKARGSESSFEYSLDTADRREKPTTIWSQSTVATVTAEFDKALLTRVMTLSLYPDDDITATPVNKYINYKDFIYAYPHEAGNSNSWVLYDGGRGVVSDSLTELVADA